MTSQRMNYRAVPCGRSTETIGGRINLAEIFGPPLRRGASKAELRTVADAAYLEMQAIREARHLRRLAKLRKIESALRGSPAS